MYNIEHTYEKIVKLNFIKKINNFRKIIVILFLTLMNTYIYICLKIINIFAIFKF